MCWILLLVRFLNRHCLRWDQKEEVDQVVKLLKSSPAVLVRDQKNYQGIITRFDVVEHLGERLW